MTQIMVKPGIMSADEALGMTLNQYLFSAGLSASSFAPKLGLSHSSVSRKLRGRVGWSLAEILSAASFFGIEPADLMPTPDGNGGWVPAPFKLGHHATPSSQTTTVRLRQDSNLQPRD